jgi:hypothetical protein
MGLTTGESWVRLNLIPDSGGASTSSVDISGQLGAKSRQFFLKMLDWLLRSGGSSFQVDYRIAPSLTTRSECELLGLSAPRFAIRAYVTDRTSGVPHPVFFNLRRLRWLANAIGQTHGHNPADVHEHAVVADALLGELPRRTDGFLVLSCDLGRAYGEEETVSRGTPFMQHVEIGGGMCAQACLQMAICLQRKHAVLIPSVAELTALAEKGNPQGQIGQGEIHLKGLRPHQIVEVLCNPNIGLRGCIESAGWDAGNPDYKMGGTPWLSFLLSTYLESQVPVMALVKLARLAGIEGTEAGKPNAIYTTNKLPFQPRMSAETSVSDHAVLLVGFRKGKADHEFLINDPAMFPFLHGTGRQLLDSRNIVRENLQFIPVLPSGVRLSLVGTTPPERGDARHDTLLGSVLWIAQLLQRPRPGLKSQATSGFGNLPVVPDGWHWPGQFRLVDWQQPEGELLDCLMSLFEVSSVESRRRLASQLVREMRLEPAHQSGRWKWFQSIGPATRPLAGETGQLWVWNAESVLPPPPTSLLRSVYSTLEGVYERASGCFRQFPRPWPKGDIR